MSLHEDLLKQAEVLAGLDKGKPKQANLRRAVSAAYYAVFHFLIDQACRQVLGSRPITLAYRRIIARAFDDGGMRAACDAFYKSQFPKGVARSLPTNFAVPVDLADVAQSFVELQEQRHFGDYDLTTSFSRPEVAALIELAQLSIEQFDRIPDETIRSFFLCCLISWKGLGGRA